MTKYARGHHPASRAALVPFTGASDPRRQPGAPSFGRQITSAMNELGRTDDQGDALYSEDDLEAIISNVKSSHARVIAAREILRARMPGFDRIDRIPKAGNSIDRIMDRTDGKPLQTVRIERKPDRRPEEIHMEILEMVSRQPEMLDQPWLSLKLVDMARQSATFRERLRPILEVHRPEMVASIQPPIDTTAEEVSVPEKKATPVLAAAVTEPAKAKESVKGKPKPKDPPEAAKAPERPQPDDFSAWM